MRSVRLKLFSNCLVSASCRLQRSDHVLGIRLRRHVLRWDYQLVLTCPREATAGRNLDVNEIRNERRGAAA